MHILVTGGTGFLGGRLIAQLARDGHQVFALTRSSASHAKLRALGASPVDADLESTAPLSLPAVDAVVHAAALFRFSGPREPFFHTNVDGTARLLVSAENAGARIFVHISAAGIITYVFSVNSEVENSFSCSSSCSCSRLPISRH